MEKVKLSNAETINVKEIKKITIIGMFVNIFLSLIKFVFGLIGNSEAIIADAIHSFSDLTTDFAIIFGVKYWTKPADIDHPYGHGRYEVIISTFIGFVLLAVGFGIGYKALSHIRSGVVSQPSFIAFWAAILSIVSKEVLCRWTLVVGKKAKSKAVMANAWHHRSDVLSSLPVAIAVAVAAISPKWSFLDYIGAFVVSLFILHAAWKIIVDALKEVIDTGASIEKRKAFEKIILETKGVISTHALRTRRVGYGWFIDLHIQVEPEMTVKEGHDISKVVEDRLKEKGQDVLDVVVHLEPVE